MNTKTHLSNCLFSAFPVLVTALGIFLIMASVKRIIKSEQNRKTMSCRMIDDLIKCEYDKNYLKDIYEKSNKEEGRC